MSLFLFRPMSAFEFVHRIEEAPEANNKCPLHSRRPHSFICLAFTMLFSALKKKIKKKTLGETEGACVALRFVAFIRLSIKNDSI